MKLVIFGGSGYIGLKLSAYFLNSGRASRVVLVDIRQPSRELLEGEVFVSGDVREPFTGELLQEKPDWIFNFAAVHREPGHAFREYFDTNLPGAQHVCDYASTVQCQNIFFTSSIAVYGPARDATTEGSGMYPKTAYGISKLIAEKNHEIWQTSQKGRRLIICRPGVVYGPDDPGNILRMIRAIRKGCFFFPGKINIFKSYAYIEGLLESISFTMEHEAELIHYNYVESPTEPLSDLVQHVRVFLGKRSPVVSLPYLLLLPASYVVQKLSGGRSSIHPVRVRKACTPTHIVPEWLRQEGFSFRYDFKRSLEDWKKARPANFE